MWSILADSDLRGRQILYVVTYTWNLKKYNQLENITKRSRLTDVENKLVVTCGKGSGRAYKGGECEVQITESKIGSRMYHTTQRIEPSL